MQTTELDPTKNLENQTKCPQCGVSWVMLGEMLSMPVEDENYQTAVHVVESCRICRLRFKKESL